ncbi:hypothetical protein [Embleya sp. NPDC001921]
MTTSKSEPLEVTLSEEARQALAEGAAPEAPTAVTEARDQLLRAIGREAEHVVATHAGEASKALVELAHAFTLATSGAPVATARLISGTGVIDLAVDFSGTLLTLTPQLVVGEAESDVNFRAPLRISVTGTNSGPATTPAS